MTPDRLALFAFPDYRVGFRIVSSGPISGPEYVWSRKDATGHLQPGDGIEYFAVAPPPVVVQVQEIATLA